jgi:hypothetical protein
VDSPLCSTIYLFELLTTPATPFNIFLYVSLAWLVIGLLIVFISPALVRRIR